MKCHRLHVRRKIKENNENEENRGLINKKSFEDQWVSLVSLVLVALTSTLSLSVLDT